MQKTFPYVALDFDKEDRKLSRLLSCLGPIGLLNVFMNIVFGPIITGGGTLKNNWADFIRCLK